LETIRQNTSMEHSSFPRSGEESQVRSLIERGITSLTVSNQRGQNTLLGLISVARNLVAVSDSDLVKMGKDPTKQVRVPPQFQAKFGNGAIATTEYAHHLHCLVIMISHAVQPSMQLTALESTSKVHIF
jgi:hypothetical protein